MRDPDDESELARRFRESATTMVPRAPLYAALSAGIADDPSLHRLLFDAPAVQRLPVLLYASTHALLIADPTHPLAEWYPNLRSSPRSPDDPELLPTFKQFVADHADEVRASLGTRSTQTNEVGRCLLFLPALGMLADEVGDLALVDVGTSGGLNLLVDRFEYRFVTEGDDAGTTVGDASRVVLTAQTRGPVPVPAEIPTIVDRVGIDLHPIDVTDDAEARWLEACVWPDQPDRFRRLLAAIDIAREAPPVLIRGDAVEELAGAVDRMAESGHPVITNSWVLNYLDATGRAAFMTELDRIGASHDISWIAAEGPALTPGLPWPTGRAAPDATAWAGTPYESETLSESHLTHLLLTTWRDGRRQVRLLATCHPHGFWLHWHPE